VGQEEGDYRIGVGNLFYGKWDLDVQQKKRIPALVIKSCHVKHGSFFLYFFFTPFFLFITPTSWVRVGFLFFSFLLLYFLCSFPYSR